ncbi:MAG TPA: glycosyltransferase, partial [Candidatus Binatus sp.]|nr:glycosyltransferase [Candidatus Binatus sp.]
FLANSTGRRPAGGPPGPRAARGNALTRRLRSLVAGATWLIRLRFGAFAWASAAAGAVTPGATVDVWHGHDLPGLVAAAAAQRRHGGALIYDAHELYLEAGTTANAPAWARSIVDRRERTLVRQADAVVTVNEAIGEELRRRFGPRRLVVVHNCPPLADLADRLEEPSEGAGTSHRRPGGIGPLRTAAGLDADAAVALYHGSLVPWRGTDMLAAAILDPRLAAVHAVFLGAGPLARTLRDLAAEPRFDGRLHVLDPVDPHDLERWIADADVGVMAIAPSTLNHRLSTPNKLFECLAAGVPVVASDFPGIRSIVCDDPAGPLGVVCDPGSPAAIATAIDTILGMPALARADLRRRCLDAARERWSWEIQAKGLLHLYADLGATA